MRVLVAEDQPVNQRVVAAMLERRGHRVEVVGNGAEAVEAVRSGAPFDVLLMDLQMPEMGGLEATRRIRELAGGSLPILALTANVAVGEEARCLEAGMDGYLAKPFHAQELFEAVERWGRPLQADGSVPGAAAPATHAGSVAVDGPTPAPAAHPVDVPALTEALGGGPSEGVVREVLALFVSDGGARLTAMQDALRRGDAEACERLAHSLKSGASGIRARRLAELLQLAEEAGRSRDTSALAARLEQIREELASVTAFVERLLSG